MTLRDLKKDCLLQTRRTLTYCFSEDVTNIPRSMLYSNRSCIEPNKILMFQEFIEHDESGGTIIKFIDIENCRTMYCFWSPDRLMFCIDRVTTIFDIFEET